MRSEPSLARSRTRGQRTATGPMPVTISRSGRCPLRTSRWRPSSVSLSAWQLIKAATSASTACASSALAPLRSTSVSGSANVPGWESWKTLVSVTAYHSFDGEVGASNTPTIRRLTPSCRHQLSWIAHQTSSGTVMQGSLSDNDWKLLLHRIKEGRCTPFLGAGASFPALPPGGGLAEQWSPEHSYPLPTRAPLPRDAQNPPATYDSKLPKEELASSFKKCARPDFSARDEPHSVLSRLPLPIYMTTNYDDFMIRALKAQGRDGVRETCRWKSDIKHLPSEFEKGY